MNRKVNNTKGNREIRDLYKRFNDKMDKVALPSDEELTQLLDRYDAEDRQRAPFIPLTPRRHYWRYAAAAIVAAALVVFGWKLWSGTPSQGPLTADTPTDSIATEPQPDTIAPTMPQPTIPDRDSRIAAIHTSDSVADTRSIIAKETADTLSLPAVPNVQQQAIAEQEMPLPVQEEQPADRGSDTTAPPLEPARGMEEYPQKPTVDETEKVIRDGNNRRALKSNRKRHINRKKEGYIEKQEEQREGLYLKIKTVPMQTPYFVPNSTGGHIIFHH